MTMRIAWGKMIRRMVSEGRMPSAAAASSWPRGMA